MLAQVSYEGGFGPYEENLDEEKQKMAKQVEYQAT